MTIPRDSIYRTFARERRRQLLRYLRHTEDGTAHLDDLVEYIQQKESDSPSSDQESIRIDLYHVQLPFLDEKEIIDLDHYSETVQYRSQARLEAELNQLTDTDNETETDTLQFP